jgi:Tol biopolymer transport system component
VEIVMKTRRIGLIAISLAALGALGSTPVLGPAPALAQTGHDLFQQALVKEQADGDLRGAIDLYERIARDFADDAALAARALIQMGQCYERLGSQEARNAYRQVLERYPNEAESAAQARARLAALTRPSPAPQPKIQSRLLMSGHYGDEVESSGGPTPDGQNLVYIDWKSESLAIRNFTSGESRMLTDDSPGYVLGAQVSPDGRWVAYTWAQNEPWRTELRVVGLAGSPPRTLLQSANEIYGPSWSRDGRHVAAAFIDEERPATEVAWVSVADGSKTTLATFPGTFAPTIAHSPNDRFVAVEFQVKEDSTRSDIALLATDGSGMRILVDHPADDRLIGWVPGNDDLLFSSDRSGNRDLWAVRVTEDGNAENLRPLRRGIGKMDPMGFTRDGSLFYSNYTLQRNTAIAPFDETTGTIALDEADPILVVGSNQRPSWSPNGEHLAFVERRQGREEVLHVLNVRTGEDRSLAEGIQPATVGAPTWFPDGRSLLVLGKEKDPERPEGSIPAVVYRVDLSTGNAEPLFQIPRTQAVGPRSWWAQIGLLATPQGDGVILMYDRRLYIHDLRTGQEEEIFRHPDFAAEVLALSPDGSELAFGISDPSTLPPGTPHQIRLNQGGRIMVMPAGGGQAREILRLQEPCAVTDPAWSSDGRYLFFQQRDEGGTFIMRVPSEGGEVERMWEAPQRMWAWAPSPDGRQVAFWIEENESEIWVMENLVDALRGPDGR